MMGLGKKLISWTEYFKVIIIRLCQKYVVIRFTFLDFHASFKIINRMQLNVQS